MIDGDPQGSLTISLGYREPDRLEFTLASLLSEIMEEQKPSVSKTIIHHEEGVDLIPANIELSALEINLVNVMSREVMLRSLLESIKSEYDYIIIDCMAKRVGQKIKMTSIDELLGVPTITGCDEIEAARIHPFKDHPFKVLDDDKMHDLVESIMMNGVLVPVTVRPLEDGDYEMISGHRRLFAVKQIGLEKIPAIVKEYDDDEAVLAMVDSNLQREKILPRLTWDSNKTALYELSLA